MRKITVADAMSAKPSRIGPEDTVVEAAKTILSKNIGSVPVCVGQKLVGLITSEDIVKRIVASNKDAKKARVKEVMTKNPVTIGADAELVDAMKLMAEKNIKRLMVVESGKLAGILTDGDVLRVAPELMDYLYAELEELKKDVQKAEADDLCEACGNYTTDLRLVSGELLCDECREAV
ncbi:MAG: CBS domain-containing protein [Candidatus Aenigmatarchaeota archaeon]|nr:MAG: CBS domain-containing protein [Candidatus Aenigmarchaeota archaeon]